MSKTQEGILTVIRRLATRYPTLRIGQIIGNALPPRFNGDPYHISDNELFHLLCEYERKGLTYNDTMR